MGFINDSGWSYVTSINFLVNALNINELSDYLDSLNTISLGEYIKDFQTDSGWTQLEIILFFSNVSNIIALDTHLKSLTNVISLGTYVKNFITDSGWSKTNVIVFFSIMTKIVELSNYLDELNIVSLGDYVKNFTVNAGWSEIVTAKFFDYIDDYKKINDFLISNGKTTAIHLKTIKNKMDWTATNLIDFCNQIINLHDLGNSTILNIFLELEQVNNPVDYINAQYKKYIISKITETIDEETTDTFTVQLTSEPESQAVINISSDDDTKLQSNKTALTFDTLNWYTSQTVTITSLNDSITDTETVKITLSIDTETSDTDFHSLTNKIITYTINNVDDSPSSTAKLRFTSEFQDQNGNILEQLTIFGEGVDYSDTYTLIISAEVLEAEKTLVSYDISVEFNKNLFIPIVKDNIQISSVFPLANAVSIDNTNGRINITASSAAALERGEGVSDEKTEIARIQVNFDEEEMRSITLPTSLQFNIELRNSIDTIFTNSFVDTDGQPNTQFYILKNDDIYNTGNVVTLEEGIETCLALFSNTAPENIDTTKSLIEIDLFRFPDIDFENIDTNTSYSGLYTNPVEMTSKKFKSSFFKKQMDGTFAFTFNNIPNNLNLFSEWYLSTDSYSYNSVTNRVTVGRPFNLQYNIVNIWSNIVDKNTWDNSALININNYLLNSNNIKELNVSVISTTNWNTLLKSLDTEEQTQINEGVVNTRENSDALSIGDKIYLAFLFTNENSLLPNIVIKQHYKIGNVNKIIKIDGTNI